LENAVIINFWKEINQPPIAAMKNLKTMTNMLPKGKAALEAAQETATYVNSLNQVMMMFEGATTLKETDRRLKSIVENFDRTKGNSEAEDCVLFSDETHLEVKIEGSAFEKDMWLCWIKDADFEPLKIVFRNGKITRTLGRLHWAHVWTNHPYRDGQGRVEVLLWPRHHTPITRRNNIVCGAIFAMFVKAFGARIQDYGLNKDVKIPDYSWKRGWKPRHKPAAWYWGWKLVRSGK
jgi:hypothetical protein